MSTIDHGRESEGTTADDGSTLTPPNKSDLTPLQQSALLCLVQLTNVEHHVATLTCGSADRLSHRITALYRSIIDFSDYAADHCGMLNLPSDHPLLTQVDYLRSHIALSQSAKP